MANVNILIAEDDGIIASRLQSILNKLGYAVPAMVASGEDAIWQAAEMQPDLVLMDVELAGDLDGIEAGGQIRAQSGIPVVYLTAYMDDALLQRAKMTEPYGYLVKPVQDRELRATIEVAIYKCRLDRQLRESEERYRAVAAELRRAHDELDKRVQERTVELSAANEVLRRQANLLANVNDAIIATDEQDIITSWNPAAVELLGWSADEALGQPMAELTHPEYVGMDQSEVASALAATGRWRGEVCHTNKSNVASICEATTMTLRDAEGSVTGYVSVIRDITERKQAQEALQRYAERLQTLHAVDRAILTAQSLEAIAQAALSYIQQLLLVQCQAAVVVLFDFEARQGVVLAASFPGEAGLKARDRIPLEMFGDIEDYRRDKVHVIQNTQAAARLSPLIQILHAGGVRSFMSVPLIVQDELVGSFNLGSDQPGGFAAEYVDIAREVASSLAIAIQQARLFERLRAGRERLQALSRRLVEVQEIERRRLAHELHDEIGQTLTAVKINLQALQLREEMAGVQPYLKDSIDVVEHALGQVRNLSLDLRPSLLDDLGLVATLRWYVDRQAQRGGFAAQLVIDLPETPHLPPELETTCFRVVQEALTNIMRHSQARNVRVELRQLEAGLLLRVCDDGVGFDVQSALENATRGISLGLLGIQERIWQVGGQIDIRSSPGGGTDVQARLPLSSGVPDPLLP
jgi:PAS domain S-box-containing protein